MKFAKELERDLVPEWRLKYLDYKLGKKKLKAISRALRNVQQTPRLRRRGVGTTFEPSPDNTAPQYAFLNRDRGDRNDLRSLAMTNSQSSLPSKPNGSRRPDEEQPLNGDSGQHTPGMTMYGSIIGTPPGGRSRRSNSETGKAPPSLKLPGAALDAAANPSPQAGPSTGAPTSLPKAKHVQLPQSTENAFEVGKTKSPTSTLPSRYKSIFGPKRVNSTPGVPVTDAARPLLRRVFTLNHKATPDSPGDVPLEAYRDLDIRQAEFFDFLDLELEKIEAFYKEKEAEATERLAVLREQLHIMRDRRLDELISHQAAKIRAKEKKKSAAREVLMNGHESSSEDAALKPKTKGTINQSWLDPLDSALEAVKTGRYGKTTKGMADLASPSNLFSRKHTDDRRDFVRRPDYSDVSYQTARRKLKVALQEYYRGLELLKSYALLNRTAFRKINKKYDKTVNARPSMRYMTEKVNGAWFVQSDVIEGHIRTVEDLYARYFEKGNNKVAIGKLRIKVARAGDFTENSFRNGLTLAAGLVFGIQGLVYGIELLDRDDIVLHIDTSYLLQIYAGYFLMNFLFLLFCLACRVWHESKINYVFVFEYDTRHHLDWRQLSELPCFYFFLLGLFMWLNFCQFGGDTMYYWYPVILICITASILIVPLPILYFRSRQWLLYSMWRLCLAGLYPVEFRDFYLGDMFCSLSYAMGNIALFFCLYSSDWDNPPMCNSSHSRLLGFFAALPAVWRALQCIRRYYDTRNVFPHLVNCGKYTATIAFYITLSVYRLQKNETHRGIFITFAIINSIYCSIWDVVMDWSLGDPYAKNRFLRPTLGYKKVWPYYTAMIIDPILRFNWVVYAIDPVQLQHSAVASFLVAFAEVCRRGMWTLFRVENEHCTNVGRFRASRDVPLPYELPTPSTEQSHSTSNRESEDQQQHRHPQVADHEPQQGTRREGGKKAKGDESPPRPGRPSHAATFASSSDLEQQLQHQLTRSTLRSRRANSFAEQPSPLARGFSRVGTILRDAHAQDFERKKKPELGKQKSMSFRKFNNHDGGNDDDSDEENDDTVDEDNDEEEDEDVRSRKSFDGENEDPRAWEEVVESEEIAEVRRDVEIGRGDQREGGGAVQTRDFAA